MRAPTPAPLPRLVLSLEELAQVLHVSRATVYRWLHRGELPIPVFRVGRTPTVRLADVEAWLGRLAEDATSDTHQRQRTPAVSPSRAGVASITAGPGRRRSRGS
jgi:excisionase family DNA binding protein